MGSNEKESWGTVGVVTVTFNSGAVLDGFLRSLLAQTYPDFLLYVVDNASVDDTLDQVRRSADPRIVLIANDDNRGVAAGNNQGIRAALAAGCQTVLLLNNDTEFEPQLLEKLAAGLDEHQCEMVVPKIYYHDQPDRLWCAGGYLSRWRASAGIHYGLDEIDAGQYDRARPIAYCPTCCMLIRRAVFERVGLMDEKYFAYFDDTDFCFRARKSRVPMFYLPHAKLWHKVSSLTGGTESAFTTRLSARNKVYFIRKNLSAGTRPLWLAVYAASLFLRWACRKDSWAVFQRRRSSFLAGLTL